MRDRLSLTLPSDLRRRLDVLAAQRNLSRSAVVEAAVASFLSPDAQDIREAAFTRRLDRLSRQSARIERDLRITADTLALFIRFWLTVTPPLATEDHASAQVKGRERFEGFVETLGQHLQSGHNFLREIPDDVVREEGGEP
jgi:predicted transcriptional regulator